MTITCISSIDSCPLIPSVLMRSIRSMIPSLSPLRNSSVKCSALGITTFLAIFLLSLADTALACPKIAGLDDLNCDGKITIVAFGDSITFGRGGIKNSTGYPDLLRKLYSKSSPKIEVIKDAKPGISTTKILKRVKSYIEQSALGLANYPDLSIVCGSPNDYWAKLTALKTRHNLISARKQLRKVGSFVMFCTLPPINREFQKSTVFEINEQIDSFAKIHFHLLDPIFDISPDLVHPDPSGHQKMFELVLDAINKIYKNSAVSSLKLSDGDNDGMFDKYESKYGASPLLLDTDADGLDDQQEIFIHQTRPDVADTDGDGVNDGDEVLAGSDPLTP